MGLTGVAEGKVSCEEYTKKMNDFVVKHTEKVKTLGNKGELHRCFDYAAAYYKKGK